MARKLLRYWFTPEYQPNADAPVEFELKPLDQGTLHTVQASFNSGVPNWVGIKAGFENGVTGWKNITLDGSAVEFNRGNARRILNQVGSADWMIWLGQIVGELYSNAFLSDEEKKT
jgi:hypothetical protein